MDKTTRMRLLSGALVVLALAAVAVWASYRSGGKPAPTPGAGIYYTGPMRSKGDRNLYATESGVITAAPAGAAAATKSAGRMQSTDE